MPHARRVGIAYGWMWIKQGVWLFRRNPFLWMFLTSILVVGMFGIALFPILGALLPGLLYPAFFAGLMLGCHALAEEQPLELRHLISGFQSHGLPLLSLGALSTVINLIAGFLVIRAAGGEAFESALKNVLQQPDPDALMQALDASGILLPMYVLLSLSLALQFVVQCAAMLIVFRGVSPLAALGSALRATLLNLPPLVVYGLMLVPLAMLASLPAMLGWLVLLPIIIASQYAIYRDMFPMPGDIVTPPGLDGSGSGDPPPA